jgi:phosphoglycolate phosphatase
LLHSSSLRHVLFDFDGTLIDSSAAILDTLATVLAEKGLNPQHPLARDLIGPPLRVTLEKLTGSTDAALLEELMQLFRQRYDSIGVAVTQAYPGSDQLVQCLKAAGLVLHLATNKRERPTLRLLERFGWLGLFDSIFCLDSRQPPFPNKAQMLTTLLSEKQIDANQAVYIGDTHHDEEASAQAGLSFLGVGWGYGVGEQQMSAQASVFTTAAALADYLVMTSKAGSQR